MDWMTWDEGWFAAQLAAHHWGMVASATPRELLRWNISKNKVCL
jgi:hypothetical protein